MKGHWASSIDSNVRRIELYIDSMYKSLHCCSWSPLYKVKFYLSKELIPRLYPIEPQEKYGQLAYQRIRKALCGFWSEVEAFLTGRERRINESKEVSEGQSVTESSIQKDLPADPSHHSASALF